MKRRQMNVVVAVIGLLAVLGASPVAIADDEGFKLKAHLRGFQEVPAVSTTGSGEFRGTISKNEDSISFELTYDGIEGTILQGHIHLGQLSVNGGIILFLCATNTTTPAAAPQGTQPCPPNGGRIFGTLTANDIRPVVGQGIETTPPAAEFAEIIHAIRSGVTYANVHSSPNHVGGEIRGQIKVND